MNNQTLSQLLDGELNTDEIDDALDALLADPELQHTWNTQHALRAAIRDNGVYAPCNIVDKVSAALEDEPAIMAPDNLTPADANRAGGHKLAGDVVPMGVKRNRLLAYAAIAASFAALVMVSYTPDDRSTGPTVADSSGTAPASPAVRQELQSMIVQHGEFSGAAALNGLVAYVKVVNDSTGVVATP